MKRVKRKKENQWVSLDAEVSDIDDAGDYHIEITGQFLSALLVQRCAKGRKLIKQIGKRKKFKLQVRVR